MPEAPPTIIVVHPKEKRKKCTVEPLRGKPAFQFWKYPYLELDKLENYVMLGLDGPLLSSADTDKGLLVLDGTWRFASVMEKDFGEIPVRSLPPWQTAYPRVSKLFDDPDQGLATIEAIFAAYTILGKETSGLLDDYYWSEQFLELNHQLIQ